VLPPQLQDAVQRVSERLERHCSVRGGDGRRRRRREGERAAVAEVLRIRRTTPLAVPAGMAPSVNLAALQHSGEPSGADLRDIQRADSPRTVPTRYTRRLGLGLLAPQPSRARPALRSTGAPERRARQPWTVVRRPHARCGGQQGGRVPQKAHHRRHSSKINDGTASVYKYSVYCTPSARRRARR
jgi:hypothetical protein